MRVTIGSLNTGVLVKATVNDGALAVDEEGAAEDDEGVAGASNAGRSLSLWHSSAYH